MRNIEQDFLDLVDYLYGKKEISNSEKEIFLKFYERFRVLNEEFNMLFEKMEILEIEKFELKRDNEMLRDELDKF